MSTTLISITPEEETEGQRGEVICPPAALWDGRVWPWLTTCDKTVAAAASPANIRTELTWVEMLSCTRGVLRQRIYEEDHLVWIFLKALNIICVCVHTLSHLVTSDYFVSSFHGL